MMIKRHFLPLAVALFALFAIAASQLHAQAPGYHVVATYKLGGGGSWDYLAFDGQGHRVFIGRQDRVMVVDAATGKLLGEVPGLKSAHGAALSEANNRGFATEGAGFVTMFDLKTLKVVGRIPAAEDADAILFDPFSKRIFTMNGDSGSASVIDPASGKNIGTIALGGKPEFGVTAGNGKLYANISDKGEVAEIDAMGMKVVRRWPVAPCASSTGLSIDVAHNRLFSVCRSKHLAVSDISAGKLVTTLPIGSGVDASAFDPGTQLIFASNGDGTMTVVHEDTPDKFTIVETVPTGPKAKTMTIDPATHRVYLGTAASGPESFALLVLDRK
jgi:YVTN family beta-propeller protein